MDFGRLPGIEEVDFSLPADHPRTLAVLKQGAPRGWEVFAGCPIWTSSGWIGKIFPHGSREKDMLKLYAGQFNSIELNATHYNIPPPVTVRRWKEQVPPHFRFFPKISRQLNHDRNLEKDEDLLEIYMRSMQEFEENLGMCFLQLPPSFSVDSAGALKDFMVRFSGYGTPLAVEFRHLSWFGTAAAAEEIFLLMEEKGISTVITDVAGRRDVLHMRLTTRTAFIRFGANNLHPTDFQRMDAWAERIKSWKDSGLGKLCFFFHTPEKALCADLAIYFADKLNRLCGNCMQKPVLIPRPALQGDLFTP